MLACRFVPFTGGSSGLVVFCYGSKKGVTKVAKKKAASTSEEKLREPRAPPRIVDTSQASLKRQLRFVESLKKVDDSKGFAPAARSKFRRKRHLPPKTSPEASTRNVEGLDLGEEEKMLRSGRGITSLYNTKALTNPPAVLVDGYNVLMRWLQEAGEETRKLKLLGDLEAARLEILRDLSDYSGWRKLRMMVAFDAQGNPEAADITRDEVGGVEVVFVGTGEADSFIIGEAEQLRKAGCPYVLVASSDNDIRDACWTNEIFPMSSLQLLKEIRKAKKEADAYYRDSLLRVRADRVGSALMRSNPALYAKLEKARLKALQK